MLAGSLVQPTEAQIFHSLLQPSLQRKKVLEDHGILTTSTEKPADGLIWANSDYRWAYRNGWHKSSEFHCCACSFVRVALLV